MKIHRFGQHALGCSVAVLAAGAGPALAQTGTVVEYYSSLYGHFFITADATEVAGLDAAGSGWQRTGAQFPVYNVGGTGVAVCRFWSGTTFAPKSTHFYTASPSECELLKSSPLWAYENVAFNVLLPTAAGTCASGTVPVYRLYNNGQGGAPNHRYTTSASVRDDMLGRGWVSEGTLGCVSSTVSPPPPGTVSGSYTASLAQLANTCTAPIGSSLPQSLVRGGQVNQNGNQVYLEFGGEPWTGTVNSIGDFTAVGAPIGGDTNDCIYRADTVMRGNFTTQSVTITLSGNKLGGMWGSQCSAYTFPCTITYRGTLAKQPPPPPQG